MNTLSETETAASNHPMNTLSETETAALATTSGSIAVKGDELEVTAQTPDEMAAANQALIRWCDHKIGLMETEAAELTAAYLHAKKSKWRFDTLQRHSNMAAARVGFYRKLKAALSAGYYIVPNFPVTAFAVRTGRKSPLKMIDTSQWNRKEQKAIPMPAGEGEYKNPFPEIRRRDVSSTDQISKGQKEFQYFAEKWKDLDFPINMARPRIMEASARAMALKIFDDLGILPDPARNADPVIIGRILDPRSTRYNRKEVSFLIAWHLDTDTI